MPQISILIKIFLQNSNHKVNTKCYTTYHIIRSFNNEEAEKEKTMKKNTIIKINLHYFAETIYNFYMYKYIHMNTILLCTTHLWKIIKCKIHAGHCMYIEHYILAHTRTQYT